LRRESLRDGLIQSFDDRDNRDDRRDTHNNANEGQPSAELVLPKTAKGDEERLPNRGDADYAKRFEAA
jgi:hypothetical protein